MMQRVLMFLLVMVSVACVGVETSLKAIRSQGKIVLDGKLEESVWKDAPSCSHFVDWRTGKESKSKTECRFVYDSSALYVGIKAMLAPDTKLTVQDKNLYAGECVEVMLDPGATHNRYFHFIANPNGATEDEYRDQGGFVGDMKWEGIWESASFVGEGFWTCEMRIPYCGLDFIAGDSATWSFNVARCARGLAPNGGMEDSAATPDGSFHVAGKYPLLTGFDFSFAPFAEWHISRPVTTTARQGNNLALTTSVALSNGLGISRGVLASVDIISADKSESQRRNIRAEIGGNSSEVLKVDNLVFTKAGDYVQQVTLRNPKNKRILHQRVFPLSVRFQAMSIQLTDPSYKQAIFASMNLAKVRYTLDIALPESELAGKSVRSGICLPDGKLLASQERPASAKIAFEFPAETLPEAKMQIFAELLDGNGTKMESTHLELRKLPRLQGEVWLDKDHTVVLDGKRIFPIMQWSANNDFIEGVDVFLDWTPYRNTRVISPVFSHNKRMSKLRKGTSVSAEEEKLIRQTVAAERQKPMTFCYLLADEPEVFGDTVEAMEAMYKIISDEDPYHPVLIGNNTTGGCEDFAGTGDLNALHSYARIRREKPFAKYGGVMRVMAAYQNAQKSRYQQQGAIWNALCFDYTNYAQVNARIPRYIEMRNEFLHSIILGARGIFLYNSLAEHYPEIGIGTVQATLEIKSYAEMLAMPEKQNGLTCTVNGIKGTVREKDGELLLIVGNLSDETLSNVTFTVPGLNNRPLSVMTEDRVIQAAGNDVTDTFAPWDVHVYRTGNPQRLMSRKEIEEAIDAINAKRAKKGNLAFQRFEGETVAVTASSNAGFNVRADNALWHVADGVIEPDDFKRYVDNLVVWQDTTPNQAPDWIALEFPKPVKMGRVVVYPVENSLQDYEVQVWKEGDWHSVAKVTDAMGCPQVHVFEPCESTKVRIFITKTRTPNARITEIEVYEK